jgi:hypothetical protein
LRTTIRLTSTDFFGLPAHNAKLRKLNPFVRLSRYATDASHAVIAGIEELRILLCGTSLGFPWRYHDAREMPRFSRAFQTLMSRDLRFSILCCLSAE